MFVDKWAPKVMAPWGLEQTMHLLFDLLLKRGPDFIVAKEKLSVTVNMQEEELDFFMTFCEALHCAHSPTHQCKRGQS